jgi:uncharacterized protein YbjT (DUF2867 family)
MKKIVVTTPTGHIGSKLSTMLLDRHVEITVIARNPEKVAGLKSRGAKVIAGEHVEGNALERAVQDADALFWLTPPILTSRDPLGDAQRYADHAATVIRKYPELYVVQLSSVGANRPDGTGPIAGLHATEQRFRAVGRNIVSLRANYFMENILNFLPTIVSDGNIYSNVPGDVRMRQVATVDIAEAAADRLLSPQRGHHIVDVMGPEDISFDETTAALTAVTGKTIRHVPVPGEALKQGLVNAGTSLEVAESFVEMNEALAAGLGSELLGDAKFIGKTTIGQFVRDVFLPAYRQATGLARAS